MANDIGHIDSITSHCWHISMMPLFMFIIICIIFISSTILSCIILTCIILTYIVWTCIILTCIILTYIIWTCIILTYVFWICIFWHVIDLLTYLPLSLVLVICDDDPISIDFKIYIYWKWSMIFRLIFIMCDDFTTQDGCCQTQLKYFMNDMT